MFFYQIYLSCSHLSNCAYRSYLLTAIEHIFSNHLNILFRLGINIFISFTLLWTLIPFSTKYFELFILWLSLLEAFCSIIYCYHVSSLSTIISFFQVSIIFPFQGNFILFVISNVSVQAMKTITNKTTGISKTANFFRKQRSENENTIYHS